MVKHTILTQTHFKIGIQRIELAKIRKLAEKPLLLKQLLELIQNNYSITEINYEENAIGVESFN